MAFYKPWRNMVITDKYVDSYIDFISNCKTERECIEYARKKLSEHGFRDYGSGVPKDAYETNAPNGKVVISKMGKTLAAFKFGRKPIEEGLNILCAHVDSPRLDIKMNPVFNEKGLTFLDTHYYGGIRKYQWVTRPLALHGVVCKKDGTTIKICIGEEDEDPVFYISDLLPHLAQDQITKTAGTFITGEELDLIVGNTVPTKEQEDDDKFKLENSILDILKETYNIEKEDFQSAELEVVPAGRARYVGFDKNLIAGYGHDDRSCAFASLEAFLETEPTDKTTCLLLVDKEEIGSYGATGMDSNTFENMVAEVVYSQGGNELTLRRCLSNSNILSSDVNAAYDPHHADLFDTKNTCYLGKGASFCKFTGSRGKSGANDANPEYIAKIRNALDSKNIPYQMSELGKVDKGGGGTIALYAARYGMNTIDIGVPVLAMHAPTEIIDKRDLFNTEQIYVNFLTI